MATLEDVKTGLQGVMENVTGVDLKLDEIKAKIDSLVAGQVSQEQIDEINSLVQFAKQSTSNILKEAGEMVAPSEPAPVEAEEVQPESGGNTENSGN